MSRDEYIVINCVIIIGNGIFMNNVRIEPTNVNEFSLGFGWPLMRIFRFPINV